MISQTSLPAARRPFGRGARRRRQPAASEPHERARAGPAGLPRARVRVPARRQRRQQHDRADGRGGVPGLREGARAAGAAPVVAAADRDAVGRTPTACIRSWSDCSSCSSSSGSPSSPTSACWSRPLTRDEYQPGTGAGPAQPVTRTWISRSRGRPRSPPATATTGWGGRAADCVGGRAATLSRRASRWPATRRSAPARLDRRRRSCREWPAGLAKPTRRRRRGPRCSPSSDLLTLRQRHGAGAGRQRARRARASARRTC